MKKISLFIVCIGLSVIGWSQKNINSVEYSVNSRFNSGEGVYAPFLSSVNQYDRHSLTPNSLSTWWGILKKTSNSVDFGFGLELNTNVSPTETRLFAGEYFLEGKVGPFMAVLGAKRMVYGNQDHELSSGGLISSQNNRPLPGLTLETKNWVSVPYTKGYVEFTGGMFNGWFSDKTVTTNTLLHHKWLHGRIGGKLPLTVNYGLHHIAQWGGNSPVYGEAKVDLDNFVRIALAKNGSASGPATEFYNTLGNHIISQNLGLSLKLASMSAEVYWQNINEDKPVLSMNKTYNKRDGLWGISVRIPRFYLLHSFVVEYLSTTDQNGPWHDMDGVIYGGMDGYYNNGVYPNGYSYFGMTMGNPWLTSPKYNTDGGVGIQNNCVRLFYWSGMGTWKAYKYRLTGAYSKNWGFAKRVATLPKNQMSAQLEVFHPLPFINNMEASVGISADRGTQYGNNTALMVGLRYSGGFKLHGE